MFEKPRLSDTPKASKARAIGINKTANFIPPKYNKFKFYIIFADENALNAAPITPASFKRLACFMTVFLQ